MSQECVAKCVFYRQCRNVAEFDGGARRNAIGEKFGLYAAADRRIEAAADLQEVGETMCRSKNPSELESCMIVAAAAVKSAINKA